MSSKARPSRRLTDLELEIMQAVWDAHPRALTVRDVVSRMEERGRSLAYTTVQTMLTILRRKGVLSSRPGPGRAHEFQARVTRSEATRTMTRDFVERMFAGSSQTLMAHLLEHAPVSRSELEELKRRIETQLEDDDEGGEEPA